MNIAKLPAPETVGDPVDPESASLFDSMEKKITKAQVNDVKHYVEHSMSAVGRAEEDHRQGRQKGGRAGSFEEH